MPAAAIPLERSRDTRGRILATSLDLFNASGFDRVSTAQIAAAVGIRQGNLWYHFRAKRDLALAHLDWLEAELVELLDAPMRPAGVSLVAEFKDSMRRINRFRYLLRDRIPDLETSPCGERLQSLFVLIEERVAARMRASVQQGILRASEPEIMHLAITSVVLMRYWLDYVRVRDGAGVDPEEAFDRGIVQLGALLRPYLTGGAALLVANARPEA